MNKKESLDTLLQVLTDMTRCRRKPQASRMAQQIAKIENALLIAFTICMSVTVIVAVFYRYFIMGADGPMPPVVTALYLLSISIALLCFIAVCASLATLIFELRRKSLTPVVDRLRIDLPQDAAFLDQLRNFDKQTLEYGLSQYQYHWEATNGRIAVLAGRIREVGLFPALTAASMAAATLLKEDGNLILWAPLILACCFYMLGTILLSNSERSAQVIRLLQHAVKYSDEQTYTPMNANPRPSNKTETSGSAKPAGT